MTADLSWPITLIVPCTSAVEPLGLELKMSPSSKTSTEIPVLVTTAHRGVFFGYAVETNSKTINLRAARNCLYWPSSDLWGIDPPSALRAISTSAVAAVRPKW